MMMSDKLQFVVTRRIAQAFKDLLVSPQPSSTSYLHAFPGAGGLVHSRDNLQVAAAKLARYGTLTTRQQTISDWSHKPYHGR